MNSAIRSFSKVGVWQWAVVILVSAMPAMADTPKPVSPIQQAADGVLTLPAPAATLTGICELGLVCNLPAVTKWTSANDVVSWNATVGRSGLYEVMITYAADSDSSGSEFAVTVGDQTFPGKTEATGEVNGWSQFNSVAVGGVKLTKSGSIHVAVSCVKKSAGAVMCLRGVVLRPATIEEITRRSTASHPSGPVEGDAPLLISVDVSDVPAWEDWGNEIRDYLRPRYGVIAKRLHTDGFTPPRAFGIRVIPALNATGRDSAGRSFEITAFANEYHTLVTSQKWARADNHGMMAHELTHIIQAYPSSEHWIREGIADYIRYYVIEPGSDHAAFDHSRADYRSGYQATAAFLNWIEVHYSSGRGGSIVNQLNDALRRGAYSPEIFRQTTGKDLEQLWTDFKKTL